jgi:hypothetical protein
MNNQDKNEIQANTLTDLPLADEQADETKAGTSLGYQGKMVKIDFCKTS